VSEELAGLGEGLYDLLRQAGKLREEDVDLAEMQEIAESFLSDAVAQVWVNRQLGETSVKMLDFRNGLAMDLEPAQELVALFVGMCRGLLGNAPNYSETVMDHLPRVGDQIEQTVKVAESPDRYVITVKRDAPGAMSPHQAREKAEKQRDDLVAAVWDHIASVNDGAGFDVDDLGWKLTQMGFPPPPDEED
jgi:hypothetical protein